RAPLSHGAACPKRRAATARESARRPAVSGRRRVHGHAADVLGADAVREKNQRDEDGRHWCHRRQDVPQPHRFLPTCIAYPTTLTKTYVSIMEQSTAALSITRLFRASSGAPCIEADGVRRASQSPRR